MEILETNETFVSAVVFTFQRFYEASRNGQILSPSNSHSFSKASTLTWKKFRSSVAFDIQNIRGRRSDESLRTLGVLISPSCSAELDTLT